MRLGRILVEMIEQGGEGRQPIDISLGSTEIRQEMCVHNKSIELQTNSADKLRWTIEIQQFNIPESIRRRSVIERRDPTASDRLACRYSWSEDAEIVADR